jgi:hypothetical protein
MGTDLRGRALRLRAEVRLAEKFHRKVALRLAILNIPRTCLAEPPLRRHVVPRSPPLRVYGNCAEVNGAKSTIESKHRSESRPLVVSGGVL